MKSKCLKYEIPSSTCIPLSTRGKHQWGPISYQNGDGYTSAQATNTDTGTTTVTVTFTEFNKTKKDEFSIDRNLETFRVAEDSTVTKDFYGSQPTSILPCFFCSHRALSCSASLF